MSTRRLVAALLLLALAVSACSSDGDADTDGGGEEASTTRAAALPVATAPASTVETPTSGSTGDAGIELPDTPAGRQLDWVLAEGASASDADYDAHVASSFLAQVPVADMRASVGATGVLTPTEVVSSDETGLTVIASSAAGELAVTITVEPLAPHRIVGLLAVPAEAPEVPTTWEGLEELLETAGAQSSYLVAEVDPDGTVVPVRSSGGRGSVPLGSAFKLYVLGTLVAAVEAGELAWDDELTITADLKSLPSGQLQDRPDGSTVPVHEAAGLMIAISDNTATDLLIDRLGRERIESMLPRMGMTPDSIERTIPFLTTRELFTVKWGVEEAVRDGYVAAAADERRAILRDIAGRPLPAPGDFDPSVPVAIDEVEWFATPAEVIAAHLWLDEYRRRPGFEPLAGILGDNRGLQLEPETWPEVSFKGGSEPGVILLGFLLHHVDGRRIAVVVSAMDDAAPVDELAAATAAQGMVDLLASG